MNKDFLKKSTIKFVETNYLFYICSERKLNLMNYREIHSLLEEAASNTREWKEMLAIGPMSHPRETRLKIWHTPKGEHYWIDSNGETGTFYREKTTVNLMFESSKTSIIYKGRYDYIEDKTLEENLQNALKEFVTSLGIVEDHPNHFKNY